MRPDQVQRLQELSERLADTFISEADPAEWPGADKPLAERTKEDRGNAYWAKKNAMATGGVLRYVLDLSARSPTDAMGNPVDADGADMDRAIADAEKRAAASVARVLDKAKKGEFDKRVLGR